MDASTTTFLPIPPARDIPSTFTASLLSWWNAGEKQSAASEERLLRRISSFLPQRSVGIASNDNPVVSYSTRVELDTPKHYINTLSMESTSPSTSAPPPAVLLHGYGAGLGFFYQNLPTLADWAKRHGSSAFALDWLGMGRSARVPFNVKAKRDDIRGRVNEAESFFIDSLEEWRSKMGLEKMTLIGHSLGGYLSVAYALRHPTRVSKLILISPAGVPRDPNSTDHARELTDSQEGTATATGIGSGTVKYASKSDVEEIHAEQVAEKRAESRTRRLLLRLWEDGWSPFQVVRSTLFWGPMLVGKYSSRRFAGLTEEDTRDLHDYILNITLAKGSGEYCISHILAPGAFARMPLVDRIHELKIPVTFVYGDSDWMDPRGGIESVENLRQAGNGRGKMYLVKNAGHHVYLDNPKAVNKVLRQELDST